MIKYIVFFMLSVLFLGCSQKIYIRALEPADVDRISQTKKVTVTNFKHDRVGLSRKIEAKLASYKIYNKKYFTIVSRNDFDKIIKEQKLQTSGLVADKDIVEVGELIGAQAIIAGEVSPPSKQDSYFYETRVRCKDLKCKSLLYYNVRCMKRVVGLSAELRIVDIQKGDVIYADTLSNNQTYKHCSDDSRALPSTQIASSNIADKLANRFVYKLLPHYRNFEVTLLEDPDLDYTDEQEKLLKVSLEYIKQNRYDKAERFLSELIDSTDSKSYVAFYNLGVIKEAEGKYKEAQEYYQEADNLMVEPVDEINKAVVRIAHLIQNKQKTMEQINR